VFAVTIGMIDWELEVILGGGAKAGIVPVRDYVIDLAKRAGAKAILCQGRSGWRHFLPGSRQTGPGGTYYRLEL
jgi:hypothetical protein